MVSRIGGATSAAASCFTLLMRGPALTALLAALAVVLVAAPVGARKKPKLLWATINVCDTAKHPNKMGVRARMPGNGTRQRMFMRFSAQFFDTKRDRWRRVKGARSPWVKLGSAVFRYREAGFYFPFKKPTPGTSFLARGVVQFQWRKKRAHRRGWRVVKRRRQVTRGGHRGTRDSDPKGFSAARCRIRTPVL